MRKKRKIINVFNDKTIYSVKHIISISNEETLNEFWYFLGNSNYFHDDNIFEYLIELYNLALSYISKEETKFFEIILEESEEHLYFTVWNKKAAILFKQYSKRKIFEYLYDNKRVTIKLNKTIEKRKIEYTQLSPLIGSAELQELEDFNENIQNIIKQIYKFGFHDNLFISLRSNLSMLCLSFQNYKESKHISVYIVNFLNLLHHNRKKFINFKQNEFKILDNFTKNIDHWLYNIFIKCEKDIHFMDHVLNVNYESLVEVVTSKEI